MTVSQRVKSKIADMKKHIPKKEIFELEQSQMSQIVLDSVRSEIQKSSERQIEGVSDLNPDEERRYR